MVKEKSKWLERKNRNDNMYDYIWNRIGKHKADKKHKTLVEMIVPKPDLHEADPVKLSKKTLRHDYL
jgi:hypothetical protein